MLTARDMDSEGPLLVLYDGACGLCQRSVRFLLARDRRDALTFAALEGPIGRAVLARHPAAATGVDSMRVVMDHGGRKERVLDRSRAAIAAAVALGGAWRLVRVLEMLPRRWLDALYDGIARRRHRWFSPDACMLPGPRDRAKLLDLSAPVPTGDETVPLAHAEGDSAGRTEATR